MENNKAEVVVDSKLDDEKRFLFGILPFDPLFVVIALVYGVTR